jgi:hypothetical protein
MHPIRSSAFRLLTVSVLALGAPACVSTTRNGASAAPGVNAPAGYTDVADRLLFGRSIPGGGEVSDAEVEAFLRDVVTPAFPQGFTVLTSRGQWQEASGAIAREAGFVLEVTHPPDAQTDAKLQRIADEYKRRFRQEAVLRVTTPASMRFYEE